jgi:RimJ/RimL family protein N-acetyltransferase
MRIAIRPYQKSDLEQFYRVVTESALHLQSWMSWCHKNYSVEDAQQWISLCIDNWETKTEFRDHGLQRVEINVLTNNHASNKVAQKIGSLLEGTFRNKLYHNDKSYPANCYSIVPTDYEI